MLARPSLRPRSRRARRPRATESKRNSYESNSIGADVERSLTRRRHAIASVVSLVFALFLTATALVAAGGADRPTPSPFPGPNPIGGGVYFVLGTAGYAFALNARPG